MKKLITIMAIIMAMVSVLLVPAVASAGDTTTVSATIAPTLTVSALATIPIPPSGNLVIGMNDASDHTVTVTSNANWSLTVVETSGDGFMKNGGIRLTTKVEVKAGTVDYGWVTPPGWTLKNDGVPGTTPITNVHVRQNIVTADPVGTYSILLTFVVAPR